MFRQATTIDFFTGYLLLTLFLQQSSPKVPHKPNSVMVINGMEVDIRADDLNVIEELGRGAYGVVEKVSSQCSAEFSEKPAFQ